MKALILILLLLNFVLAKEGIWVNIDHSKPIYKKTKRVIPKRICKEKLVHHKYKVVKRCKNYDRIVYDDFLYGYENIVKFKSNGKKHKLKFFTDKKFFEVKIGVLNYR